ncbi:protein transport protein SEC24 [Angomonas deanei]|uniref:Sec23/Sec24 zinc finger/Sec23/Sec24 trunk domain/Sec23/Sec24 beta-sandwich domain/Sec23/Sec24 helical domain containing protein, putative n=1 Tax=Angomonas deanei TaxID=59799 RepID=A0A7G2C135_9TRYP|nr:protein transport protein SEC24 [Angomonas deanei]CAD2213430.1 Sec23/Sec24 zinc finger/Sec23/Sec24 trunk domain/Sec23/Sec24 beta-sandwich domain/Sec23/Sec24 helical domain containing protein, putative [Angomonas deanei]|eukprot:EPY23307.1 protein transport protein SEC24 [Angomonas deanei]
MPSDIAENLARFPAAPAHIRTSSLLSVRPTFATFPKSTKANNLLQSIGLPVGVVVRPFAEQDVPVADFTSFGDKMIRCRKCTAYINPFCTFSEGGRKWMCSLCRYSNETPKSYYCPADESGLRQDINDRQELLNCSIDLLATPEFLKSPPMRPVIVFLLDFSYAAVSSGLLGVMCDAALAALENLKENDALHVAVVGFDNNVYLTNFGENAAGTPRIVVVPDVVNELCNINDSFRLEPIELPCAVRECVVPLKFCFDQLCTLLQELPNTFASTKEVGCAFGGALSASVTLLSRTGGKIISSICSIPSNGEGKLKQRFDMGSLSGKPNEYTVCSVGNDWYKQRALVCSSCNISFDLVAGGTDDLDLATISPLCRYTSGNIVRASPANMSGMTEQVQLMIERAVAFDSVFRVRSSNGVVIQNFYGHCHVKEPDLLSLPIATTDSTYGIELKIPHDYLLKFVYLQFASVYTTPSQERRIRVHTVQLRVSQNPTDVINSIDSFGMASFLCRSCVDLAGSSPFEQAQAKTNERLATALRFCQTHLTAVGQTPGAGQLLIPVSMQFIPQILNGFYRLPAVCLGSKTPIRPDERIASMSTVMTCSPEALAAISAMWCYTVYSPGHRVEELPMQMHSSISCFRNDGMYFVNLGVSLVLWYGTMVHPEILKLFGLHQMRKTTRQAARSTSPRTN